MSKDQDLGLVMATWHQSNTWKCGKKQLERRGCSSDGKLGLEVAMSRRDSVKARRLYEIAKEGSRVMRGPDRANQSDLSYLQGHYQTIKQPLGTAPHSV